MGKKAFLKSTLFLKIDAYDIKIISLWSREQELSLFLGKENWDTEWVNAWCRVHNLRLRSGLSPAGFEFFRLNNPAARNTNDNIMALKRWGENKSNEKKGFHSWSSVQLNQGTSNFNLWSQGLIGVSASLANQNFQIFIAIACGNWPLSAYLS